MKQKIIYSLTALAFLATGCVQNDIEKNGGNTDGQGEKVVFVGGKGKADAKADTKTRTSLGDTSTDPVDVLWTAGDAIGVFAAPSSSSETVAANVKASLMEGAGERYGSLLSLGIKMAETGNVFHLYYPYDAKAATAALSDNDSPVKYDEDDGTGNPCIAALLPPNQTQVAPGDYSHFGRYGYATATTEAVNKGEQVSFKMNHPLTYVELSLYSASLGDFYVDEVTMSSSAGTDRLAGPFGARFDGTYLPADAGVLPSNFSNRIALTLSDPQLLAGSSAAAPHKFLLSMLPADMTGKQFKIVVKVSKNVGAEGKSSRFYAFSVDGGNFESDCLYKIKGSLDSWTRIYPLRAAIVWQEGAAIDVTDVDLVTGTRNTDLESKLANSFIINQGGSYSFPAKKADGTWVDGIEQDNFNYITFTVPENKQGNALIGLYRWDPDDPTGNSNLILYSWHLWMDDPQEVTVKGMTMLDRNLGATADYPADNQSAIDSYGYYFQWGRKDPFIRAAYDPTQVPAGMPQDASTTETVAFATQPATRLNKLNKEVFGSNLHWGLIRSKQTYGSSYNVPTLMIDGVVTGSMVLWGVTVALTEGHQNMPLFDPTKLVEWPAHADPCPKGFHVPTRDEYKAISSATANKVGTYKGTAYTDGASSSWFPLTGYRNNEYGGFQGFGSEFNMWTNGTKPFDGRPGWYAYTWGGAGAFSDGSNGRISGARGMRCIKNK